MAQVSENLTFSSCFGVDSQNVFRVFKHYVPHAVVLLALVCSDMVNLNRWSGVVVLNALLQAGFDELVEIAVEHALRVAALDVGT